MCLREYCFPESLLQSHGGLGRFGGADTTTSATFQEGYGLQRFACIITPAFLKSFGREFVFLGSCSDGGKSSSNHAFRLCSAAVCGRYFRTATCRAWRVVSLVGYIPRWV